MAIYTTIRKLDYLIITSNEPLFVSDRVASTIAHCIVNEFVSETFTYAVISSSICNPCNSPYPASWNSLFFIDRSLFHSHTFSLTSAKGLIIALLVSRGMAIQPISGFKGIKHAVDTRLLL